MHNAVLVAQVAADAFGVVQFPLGRLAVSVDIHRLVVLEVLAVGGQDGQVGVAGKFPPVTFCATGTGNGFPGA